MQLKLDKHNCTLLCNYTSLNLKKIRFNATFILFLDREPLFMRPNTVSAIFTGEPIAISTLQAVHSRNCNRYSIKLSESVLKQYGTNPVVITI